MVLFWIAFVVAIGFRSDSRNGATAREGNRQEQGEALPGPLLPDPRLAARHQHLHVWLLLGRIEQLSRHLQQGGARHYGRHGHLFRHPLDGSVSQSTARAQGSEPRQVDTECSRGNADLAGGFHHLRGHQASGGLLPIGSTHRFGQWPSLPCLPEYVYQCGAPRPARHSQ